MNKILITRAIFAGFVGGIALYGMALPSVIHADLEHIDAQANQSTLVHNGHLTICKLDKEAFVAVKSVKMIITHYSSTPDQTDDTPFITASGKHVADGIIANNMLPFGTKVRFPELHGDKVFTVEDRMHSRKGKYMADIWVESREEAKELGAKHNIVVEILEI